MGHDVVDVLAPRTDLDTDDHAAGFLPRADRIVECCVSRDKQDENLIQIVALQLRKLVFWPSLRL